jgi:pre-rRNA-processing protein IPI3
MSSSREIVLTSSPDGPITAYDIFSGTTLARFSGSRSPRHGLVLAGKAYIAASHISSATASGSIHLYNWWSSTAFHHLPVPEPVAPLAATPDGSFLFAGGVSGNVYALSIPSGNILKSFPAHTKPVSCLTISNDGSLLISGGDDGTILVVPIFQLVEQTTDGNCSDLMLHSFVAHDGPVTSITCIGFCHYTVISCSTDCTCKLWSLLDGTNLRKITFPCAISRIALDPTGTEFYAAGADGSIYKGFLKVGSRKQVSRMLELAILADKHGGAIISVVMTNAGKNLVSAAEDGRVYLWEVERGLVIMVLGNNMESISDLVVASGIGDARRQGVRAGDNMNKSVGGGIVLSGKEFTRSIKDTVEIEDVLSVAAKDRSKAIDMLESAIGVYERLLELILKEAKGGTSRNSHEDNGDM